MIIFVDFDKTLTIEHMTTIINTTPNFNLISRINEMYDAGNTIVIYSCRSNPEICDKKQEEKMIEWLSLYKVKYTRIEKNKPYYDIIIDDKAISPPFHI